MSVNRVFTRILVDWAVRCFGEDHVRNRKDRALRLAEEAIELAQAVNVPQDKLHALIGVVYARPPGDVFQELGGVFVCAHVMAGSVGLSVDDVLETEMHRVLNKPAAHFAERNQQKNILGLKG